MGLFKSLTYTAIFSSESRFTFTSSCALEKINPTCHVLVATTAIILWKENVFINKGIKIQKPTLLTKNYLNIAVYRSITFLKVLWVHQMIRITQFTCVRSWRFTRVKVEWNASRIHVTMNLTVWRIHRWKGRKNVTFQYFAIEFIIECYCFAPLYYNKK